MMAIVFFGFERRYYVKANTITGAYYEHMLDLLRTDIDENAEVNSLTVFCRTE